MASQTAFAIFLLLVILPTATLATTYIVGDESDAVDSGYFAPAPSPVEFAPWEYFTPAPSPLSPAPYADSSSDAVDSDYFAPAPSPMEFAPWEYFTPAPSPVELATSEYGTPAAPPPAEYVPWFEAPALSPANTGHAETSAKKRPFINFFRE